jgi:hypothetical protein
MVINSFGNKLKRKKTLKLHELSTLKINGEKFN